jgi:hypothetical protein
MKTFYDEGSNPAVTLLPRSYRRSGMLILNEFPAQRADGALAGGGAR